jgi:hypothetical protein
MTGTQADIMKLRFDRNCTRNLNNRNVLNFMLQLLMWKTFLILH